MQHNIKLSFPLNPVELHPLLQELLNAPNEKTKREEFTKFAEAVCRAIGKQHLEKFFTRFSLPSPIQLGLQLFLCFFDTSDLRVMISSILETLLPNEHTLSNLIVTIDRRFIHDQGEDGICYAHATAYIILEAEARIAGRKIIKLSELINKIVKRHGKDGGSSIQVLQEECPDRCLKYESIQSIEEAKKALKADRHILATFSLTNKQWENFSAFYKQYPKETLTQAIVYADEYTTLEQRMNEKKNGGHAVAIVGYEESTDAWIIRNSWGTGFACLGYFMLSVNAIKNLSLIDVYFLEENLREEEKKNYNRFGEKNVLDLTQQVFNFILKDGLFTNNYLDI